jgi:hypothetical protein
LSHSELPLIQRTLRNYDGDRARRDSRRLSAAQAGRSAWTIHFYSPVGLAAWIVDKFRSWSDCDGDIERRFTRDELLTCVSLLLVHVIDAFRRQAVLGKPPAAALLQAR